MFEPIATTVCPHLGRFSAKPESFVCRLTYRYRPTLERSLRYSMVCLLILSIRSCKLTNLQAFLHYLLHRKLLFSTVFTGKDQLTQPPSP